MEIIYLNLCCLKLVDTLGDCIFKSNTQFQEDLSSFKNKRYLNKLGGLNTCICFLKSQRSNEEVIFFFQSIIDKDGKDRERGK